MTAFIGYIAAILTTCSFVPQAVKIIRSKDTSGISLIMYVMFVLGVFFWLLYGILLDDLAIIVANVITLILTGIILRIKIQNFRAFRRGKQE